MIQHMSRHICMSIKAMTIVACLLLLKKRIALIHIVCSYFLGFFLLLILCSFYYFFASWYPRVEIVVFLCVSQSNVAVRQSENQSTRVTLATWLIVKGKS